MEAMESYGKVVAELIEAFLRGHYSPPVRDDER